MKTKYMFQSIRSKTNLGTGHVICNMGGGGGLCTVIMGPGGQVPDPLPLPCSNFVQITMQNVIMHRLAISAKRSNHKPWSFHILLTSWLVFLILTLFLYIAGLFSYYNSTFAHSATMSLPVESVDDVAAQTEIEYGFIAGGSTMEFFK